MPPVIIKNVSLLPPNAVQVTDFTVWRSLGEGNTGAYETCKPLQKMLFDGAFRAE